MEEKKDVRVPSETQDKLQELTALRKLVDKSVSLFWGEKRALKYQKQAVKLSGEIVDVLWKLFPEEMKKFKRFTWGNFENGFVVQFFNDEP